jgi:hypothetical protein
MTHPDLPEPPLVHPNPPRAVIGPARWALSPLDYDAHVLADGDQPLGVVKARCGALLPMVVPVHDQPPGRICPPCELILRADLEAPGRYARPARTATGAMRDMVTEEGARR